MKQISAPLLNHKYLPKSDLAKKIYNKSLCKTEQIKSSKKMKQEIYIVCQFQAPDIIQAHEIFKNLERYYIKVYIMPGSKQCPHGIFKTTYPSSKASDLQNRWLISEVHMHFEDILL